MRTWIVAATLAAAACGGVEESPDGDAESEMQNPAEAGLCASL